MEKSILITNYELINYTGSELNTMSIAKRFKDLGYKVYVLAMFVGEPFYSETRDCYDEIRHDFKPCYFCCSYNSRYFKSSFRYSHRFYTYPCTHIRM